jgi:Uncharacterized membrane-associated protein/domain
MCPKEFSFNMQKLHIFLSIFIVTISVFLALALVGWYLAATSPSYYGSSWMSQMWGQHLGTDGNYGGMGGMMGSSSGTTTSYLWLVPVALIVIVVVSVIGVVFYLAFPQLRYIKRTCEIPNVNSVMMEPVKSDVRLVGSSAVEPNTCGVVLKTMTPEEQKVLNVLVAHQGKYLQKYVSKEAGLSRLKTHRIVARFAQRGIVTVAEFGNTNEIVVSDWVRNSK